MTPNDTGAKCELCGEPLPAGEEMFRFHGYSGDCPKPPLPRKPTVADLVKNWRNKATESREEADHLHATLESEERCILRAQVLEACASELEAIIR